MKKTLKYYVDDFIQNNPFIEDGLYNGYINITGLSLMLIPYFKNKMESEVSFDSVKMAIFRASKNISEPHTKNIFKTKDIHIKKGINICYLKNNSENREKLGQIKKSGENYLCKINGNLEVAIIYDEFYSNDINNNFSEETLSDLKKNIVLISVIVTEQTQNKPGVMYAISKKLLFHGINIVQVIQTSQEFTICVEEKDLEDTVFAISSI